VARREGTFVSVKRAASRHLHLDPVGGLAGDMFAAALLDASPQLGALGVALGVGLLEALARAGLAPDVVVRWERVTEEVLAGTRFVVDDPRERGRPTPPHHAVLLPGIGHGNGHGHGHAHVPFAALRRQIEDSGLPAGVIARATDIFTRLARAEAHVHGFADIDAVVFHEVGAQDSVADVVAAAWLLEQLAAASFSCGALPLGAGTVKTAHGVLPVPAPATARLLEGFAVFDDGRPGERVTPTGAAILQHLAAAEGWLGTRRPAGLLGATGVGWGTRRFAGLPNVLRAVLIDVPSVAEPAGRETVTRLSFEIDDQPLEDLATALDRLRAMPGVLDVLQAPAFGKKGRMTAQVRLLCKPEVEDAVVEACLLETTTLGVRVEQLARMTLPRDAATIDGRRAKRATRPDGTVSVKLESDELAGLPGAAARKALKDRIERG
jgi:pyridinium-3,5-bisthiocarboxylic acid mononucleotide nickel chelatase